jgi:hypothetical protein
MQIALQSHSGQWDITSSCMVGLYTCRVRKGQTVHVPLSKLSELSPDSGSIRYSGGSCLLMANVSTAVCIDTHFVLCMYSACVPISLPASSMSFGELIIVRDPE